MDKAGIENSEMPLDPLVSVALDHISASWRSHLINTSIELKIYDHLSKRSMSIDELAEATKTHSPTLFRFMRALSSINIFTLNEDEKWTITPLATVIHTQFEHLSTVFRKLDASFSKLEESIKTGKCYFEEIYGLKMYDWYKSKPESMESFVYAMQEYSDAVGSKVVEAYDFSQYKHIIDIGGGQGWLMSKILKSAPNVKATVFDQAVVVDKAYKNEVIKDVRDRISFVSGDFMQNVPSGGDCYILHYVIIDYNDDNALKILRNIAEKMDENAKLVIVKQTLDSSFGAMLDILMLVTEDGKERSKNDFEILLQKVGLRVSKFLKTGKETCEILEAMKISP